MFGLWHPTCGSRAMSYSHTRNLYCNTTFLTILQRKMVNIARSRGILSEVTHRLCLASVLLEVWPESHWPGFALRKADVFQCDMAW